MCFHQCFSWHTCLSISVCIYLYIYIYIFTYVSLSIFLLRNLYNKLHGFNFTKRKKKPKLYFLISILHDEKKLSIPYNVAFIKERQRHYGYLLHCSVVVKASKFVEVLFYGVGWVRRNIKKKKRLLKFWREENLRKTFFVLKMFEIFLKTCKT